MTKDDITRFLKDWMLPLAIVLGAAFYLVLHFVPYMAVHLEPGCSAFAKNAQPVLIATMLFLQFNKISPHDLRFRKWHLIVLAFQMVTAFKLMESRREIKALFGYAFELFAGMKSGFQNTDAVS